MSWYFLADSHDLRSDKPNRLFYKGQPIVVLKYASGYQAFLDYCPHRGFPLSEGKVTRIGDELRLTCPYHGWSFNSQGNLMDRPGFKEDHPPQFCLKSFAVRVFGHLLFGADSESTEVPPWIAALDDADKDSFRHTRELNAQKIHVLENLLDPLHTHYIHAPFLRAADNRVSVDVKANYQSDLKCLHIEYLNESTPKGIISRLFEGDRTKTVGKYYHPDMAVLEYWSSKGLDLRVSLFMAEQDQHKSVGSLVFQFQKTRVPLFFKKFLFKFFTGLLVKQDFRVLEQQQQNLASASNEKFWVSEEDVVFKTMKQLYAGNQVSDFESSYKMNL